MAEAIPRTRGLLLFTPGSSGVTDLQKFNSGCLSLMFEQGTISDFMYDILQNKITFTKKIAGGLGDYNEKENKEDCIIGIKDGPLYRLSLHHGICKVFELDDSDTLLLDDKGATLIMARLPEDGKISLPIERKIKHPQSEKDLTL